MARRTTAKVAELKKPDWPLWLTVKGATLWELVDLSLNREPDFVLFAADDDPRFERLPTLRRHAAYGSTVLRRPDREAFTGEPDSIHQRFTVESFADWAVNIAGWKVPAELAALAAAVGKMREERGRAVALNLGAFASVLPPHVTQANASGPGQPLASPGLAAVAKQQAQRRHRIKGKRENVLDRVIAMAREAANGSDVAAQVWPELERLARAGDRPAPLAGVNSGGIQYHDGGQVRTFTIAALRDRLRRAARRESAR